MTEKTEYYYLSLPDGYSQSYVLDYKRGKKAVGITFGALGLFALVLAIMLIVTRFSFTDLFIDNYQVGIEAIFSSPVFILTYIVLHELLHFIGFKIITREKVKFGLNWACSYQDVPNAYIKKWPFFVVTLLPFFIFSSVLLPVAIMIDNIFISFMASFIFACHIAGSIDDFIEAGYLLFYAPEDTLVHTNGLILEFYTFSKKESVNNEGNLLT